jgi:hypothetical protein
MKARVKKKGEETGKAIHINKQILNQGNLKHCDNSNCNFSSESCE